MTGEWYQNWPENFEALHEAALRRVRAEYEAAVGIDQVRLEAMNRRRPPSMQYRSIDELVDEFLSRAGTVCTFAVSLWLITPDDAIDIIPEFFAAHPELRGDDEPVPPE